MKQFKTINMHGDIQVWRLLDYNNDWELFLEDYETYDNLGMIYEGIEDSEEYVETLRDDLIDAISLVATSHGKRCGIDYEMSDTVLEVIDYIEDLMTDQFKQQGRKIDVIINDKNDGFTSIVNIKESQYGALKRIVADEKENNQWWNIDIIEDRIKEELEDVKITHLDEAEVIQL